MRVKKIDSLESSVRAKMRCGYRIASLCLVFLISACVGSKYPELAQDLETDDSAYEYIIGAGDVLNIYVWGYPDLEESVPVRPDGKVTTKLVEDIDASGETPSALAREIERSYASFVTNPVVTVSLGEFSGSQNQQIKIVSASSNALTIPYTNGMTILDVVIEIGGLTEFANGNSAVLIRKTEGKSENYTVRIDDLIRKGDISANVKVRPGDIVLIPERWF